MFGIGLRASPRRVFWIATFGTRWRPGGFQEVTGIRTRTRCGMHSYSRQTRTLASSGRTVRRIPGSPHPPHRLAERWRADRKPARRLTTQKTNGYARGDYLGPNWRVRTDDSRKFIRALLKFGQKVAGRISSGNNDETTTSANACHSS